MKAKDLVIGAAVATAGAVLTVKKLGASKEIKQNISNARNNIKQNYKDLGKSVKDAAKDVQYNVKDEMYERLDEAKDKLEKLGDKLDKLIEDAKGTKEEIKEKVSEKEAEINKKVKQREEKKQQEKEPQEKLNNEAIEILSKAADDFWKSVQNLVTEKGKKESCDKSFEKVLEEKAEKAYDTLRAALKKYTNFFDNKEDAKDKDDFPEFGSGIDFDGLSRFFGLDDADTLCDMVGNDEDTTSKDTDNTKEEIKKSFSELKSSLKDVSTQLKDLAKQISKEIKDSKDTSENKED